MMIRTGAVYKKNKADNTMMLTNYATGEELDFWAEYRTNYARYDAVFNRMFNSFWFFMQLPDDTVDEVTEQFRDAVYDHLLINNKKYQELYRGYTLLNG